jgi:hypothetical protein
MSLHPLVDVPHAPASHLSPVFGSSGSGTILRQNRHTGHSHAVTLLL